MKSIKSRKSRKIGKVENMGIVGNGSKWLQVALIGSKLLQVHSFMAAADSAAVLLELEIQWD